MTHAQHIDWPALIIFGGMGLFFLWIIVSSIRSARRNAKDRVWAIDLNEKSQALLERQNAILERIATALEKR
jgi:hypothetical protein